MAKQKFLVKKFTKDTKKVIKQANEIIAEYQADGYKLTLRQLYYQFVARALLPNSQKSYSRLGSILNNARLAGEVDWGAIEDRTRNMQDLAHWDDVPDIMEAVSNQFRVSPWDNQDVYIEVWIEKEALTGVIQPICRKLDVPFLACRGYLSQSEQYEAARRFLRHYEEGRMPYVLHLGDHDPSGIDMTRDNESRLDLFTGGIVDVRRLALNMDQVRKFKPPPNPAKSTDARFASYKETYGKESWELDALDPRTLSKLIQDEVEALVDQENWKQTKAENQEGRDNLARVAGRWEEVLEFLDG